MRKSRSQWSTLKKFTVTTVIVVGLTGVASASYGAYLFFKPTEQSSKLTPAMIEQYTTYKSSDSSLVSTLKANALSVHLATGDDTLIKNLSSTLKTLDKLNKGTLPENKVEPLLSEIKTKYNIPDYQIAKIRTDYFIASLANQNVDFKKALNTYGALNITKVKSLADAVHHVATKLSDSYAKDVNMDYPSGLSESIDLLTSFHNKLDRLATFNDLFIRPETTQLSALQNFGTLDNFEQSFSTQFNNLSKYIELRDQVDAQTRELQAFKDAITTSKNLMDNSIKLEDFTGKTLKEAKDWASKNGTSITVEDGHENKDDSIILSQTPSVTDYERIAKGVAISVETPKLPEKEKPKESSQPSVNPTEPPKESISSSSQPITPTEPSDPPKESATPIVPPSQSSSKPSTSPSSSKTDNNDDPIKIKSTTEREP